MSMDLAAVIMVGVATIALLVFVARGDQRQSVRRGTRYTPHRLPFPPPAHRVPGDRPDAATEAFPHGPVESGGGRKKRKSRPPAIDEFGELIEPRGDQR